MQVDTIDAQRLGELPLAVRRDMVLARSPFVLHMYLLYLDDAGVVQDRNEKHFILAGIAVFERQAYWLQNALDDVAGTLGHPDPDALELHGNRILNGNGWWRKMRWRDDRRAVIRQGLGAAAKLAPGSWCLFGAVVDKRALSPQDPIAYVFEQLCNRFDRFLARMHYEGNTQRGLIVLDKSSQETRLQSLASEFRTLGHRWGVARNLADVPLFVDSRATRCIQYADLVAYAMWRKFERGDGEFFDGIARYFDGEGGAVHGLHHFKNPNDFCDCPVCAL